MSTLTIHADRSMTYRPDKPLPDALAAILQRALADDWRAIQGVHRPISIMGEPVEVIDERWAPEPTVAVIEIPAPRPTATNYDDFDDDPRNPRKFTY